MQARRLRDSIVLALIPHVIVYWRQVAIFAIYPIFPSWRSQAGFWETVMDRPGYTALGACVDGFWPACDRPWKYCFLIIRDPAALSGSPL
ncbi:hypothetical protein P153DRAFT_21837 [Dothidotthia symphoricarpi CBS 119687]|uniref:Uncharacterized protein n=1 Tax=Dothidotthia symphoricarpi CBS 119687 TaxID=1392245 RepID=A0A6A6AF61_9PLEO|nr:uncharacterized protein P153DRAFT_21837 [Dothidotthia symphoricarpi CBS 119687]KAF2129567.1 hypothetical protein P153DRAFT_21837 [Dothidotthia symphoricarpi CBS 119687]